MKNLFLFLCLAAGGLLWSAPRVAVFDEPGFPNASKRDAAFYSRVLNGRILNLKDLGKLKSFDVLIFPHGGYVPADAESAVYRYDGAW